MAVPAGSAPETPFDLIGGRVTMRAIVDRFYDLMETDPHYAELRAMHAPDLSMMRASLTGFLTAWAGGPRDWFQQNPGKCMMSAHRRLAIDSNVAAQWGDAMRRAINDVAPTNAELAEQMGELLAKMASGMAQVGEHR